MKLNRRNIFIVLFACSLLANIAWVLSDGWFEATVIKTKLVERNEQPVQQDLNHFRKELVDASIDMLEGSELSPRPLPYKHSTARANFKYNIKGYDEHTALFYWGGGWLMCSLLENAISSNDRATIDKVKEIFDKKVLSEPITRVDQSLFGIVSIMLTNVNGGGKTRDAYAEKLLSWLKSQETPNGIPYVSGIELNLVDGMGMYNPFLVYYSKVYNDTTAYKLAVKQAEIFISYAVDEETGICSHGYRMKSPHIKLGSANWGRGNVSVRNAILPFKVS